MRGDVFGIPPAPQPAPDPARVPCPSPVLDGPKRPPRRERTGDAHPRRRLVLALGLVVLLGALAAGAVFMTGSLSVTDIAGEARDGVEPLVAADYPGWVVEDFASSQLAAPGKPRRHVVTVTLRHPDEPRFLLAVDYEWETADRWGTQESFFAHSEGAPDDPASSFPSFFATEFAPRGEVVYCRGVEPVAADTSQAEQMYEVRYRVYGSEQDAGAAEMYALCLWDPAGATWEATP